ncbi:hypothetical protein BU24DRAFT_159169 [Aaosphaeria arxii CBS 175.79]|uniref:Uncharacterized protein n=1 Tax=Aaosphaeria arxii CBS 175.79 TaxID=1450172 RepID=A0A6A5XXX1_9PLEO|nr:uncharacterized protein BU24DRAFT_159169 [Aaosphaeria arxii CBS 175.79]KAF2017799.1 hypothetical protein BU24DRAFT_159169 [Aaosphaeria arxii CBS 175.79]
MMAARRLWTFQLRICQSFLETITCSCFLFFASLVHRLLLPHLLLLLPHPSSSSHPVSNPSQHSGPYPVSSPTWVSIPPTYLRSDPSINLPTKLPLVTERTRRNRPSG